MPNFLEEIEETMDEPIISVVITQDEYGHFDDADGYYQSSRSIGKNYVNRVLPWHLGRAFLDYEYDNGYGGVDSHYVTVWSENWVGFVVCYDGSSWVSKVPRNPRDHLAFAFGGG